MLQKAFNSFDAQKTGSISTETVAEILRLMGQPFNKKILEELIDEVDEDSEYKIAVFLFFFNGRENASQSFWNKVKNTISLE